MNTMKQPIGSFEAISAEHIREIVIVSQETRLDCQNLVVAARKIFTLTSADGEEIFRAENPQTFNKNDGTTLKKITTCRIQDMFSS